MLSQAKKFLTEKFLILTPKKQFLTLEEKISYTFLSNFSSENDF